MRFGDPKNQEDVNGEKLTVTKWWIFGADFSRFAQSFSRFIRDINGEKKVLVIDDFFTVSFSRFTPSRKKKNLSKKYGKIPGNSGLPFKESSAKKKADPGNSDKLSLGNPHGYLGMIFIGG